LVAVGGGVLVAVGGVSLALAGSMTMLAPARVFPD